VTLPDFLANRFGRAYGQSGQEQCIGCGITGAESAAHDRAEPRTSALLRREDLGWTCTHHDVMMRA
jgi:hypothetical protein